MLKVLVVDDEPRQRRILTQIIRQYRPNYEVFEEKNGYEVLCRSDLSEFHIAFTDIRMPKTDGLSMLEQFTKVNPDLRIIIISGYGEFEYAQKAISLHAHHYILKPISEEVIWEAITQVEESIFKSRIAVQEQEKLSDYYKAYIIQKWLSGNYTVEEKEQALSILPNGVWTVVAEIRVAGTGAEDAVNWDQSLGNFKKDMEQFGLSIMHFPVEKRNNCACIIRGHDINDRFQHRVYPQLAQLIGDNMIVGIGEQEDGDISDPEIQYEKAKAAADCLFYFQDTKFLFFHDISDNYTESIDLPKSMIHDLKREIMTSEETAPNWIEQWLNTLLSGGYVRPVRLIDSVRGAFLQSLGELDNLLSENELSSLKQRIHEQLYLEIISVKILVKHIDALINHIKGQIGKKRQNRAFRAIEECIADISSNYQQEYSLTAIAQKYYFNPSYFSTLFKKHTGKQFTEYLVEVRLEHAVRLLVETNDKIYEIAKKVGYQDVKYFNRLFKKRHGCTPEEYRVYERTSK